MKKCLPVTLMILVFSLSLLCGIVTQSANPNVRQALAADEGLVSLSVTKTEKGDSSKPGEILYSYEVTVTNKSSETVKFNNNDFVLLDDKGAKYGVTRFRFKDHITLEPGKSANSDRIYFLLPEKAKPRALVLHKKKNVLGKTAL
jgi:hypothetical protein